jgi:hypothetical protein
MMLLEFIELSNLRMALGFVCSTIKESAPKQALASGDSARQDH